MSEYNYDFFNEEGKVICQICGKPFFVVSPRHIHLHNISYSEYKLRFPDAPLSCKAFAAKGKYGKEKNIFIRNALEKIENNNIPPHDVNPVIDEEINFDNLIKETSSCDICSISKDKILDFLKLFFTNVKKDYLIQEFSSDRLLYESISDFADPILKINIEFPNCFWHNEMAYKDLNRDQNLKEFGWKIIKIYSETPNLKDIEKAIKQS